MRKTIKYLRRLELQSEPYFMWQSKPKLTPDQIAAHEFLAELRTRISVQPLPYQWGVEARALESLWELFAHARTAMKEHPGCERFARAVTEVLNVDVRPVTAKWHRAHAEGRLNSRDGADEFRGDLAALQDKLRAFAQALHEMAYGRRALDEFTPDVLSAKELARCLQDVAFGIAKGGPIDDPTVDAMRKTEAEEVAARRWRYQITTPAGMNAVGLGLSGGGIRSATFCLGAVQVLAARNLLRHVDFLSTVSGGGYTGCFLTKRLGNAQPHRDIAGPYGPDPEPVQYLRRHAKYLSATDLRQAWSMVTATLAGLLLNWSAPLLVIAFLALAATCVPKPSWDVLTGISGGLAGIALVLYGGLMRAGRASALLSGWLLGLLVAATAAFGICWLIDCVYGPVVDLLPGWKTVTIVGSVAAAGPTILRFVPLLKKPIIRQIVLRILLIAAGIVVPIGAIILFFVFRSLGRAEHAMSLGPWSGSGSTVLAAIVVFLFIVAVFVLNINLTGPHRLYRDQLARTFIRRPDDKQTANPLREMNPQFSAPYHLINATVNLPSSKCDALRDRKGDFFLFSKHWCGAPTTGYVPTKEWRTDGQAADLATAMATSGAAFSSHMGLGSMPTLTALLTFLNVRLGYWIRHPDRKGVFESPGFLCLIREMTGIAMSEKRRWLNLSDGGHIENMAIYELLRRRCKYIISIDGEADPQCSFHGHLTLVRHAQIDLGIRIDARLDDLRPDSASKNSRTHYMFCRTHYPTAAGQPEEIGLLLYVKLSATGDEEELIKRYRRTHPDFPHQSTLDQFFDEEQFEAYRQLGVHVLDGLFSRAIMNGKTPTTIAEWFRELARNLLEPAETRRRAGVS